MKNTLCILSFLSVTMSFNGCSKSQDTTPTPPVPATALQITTTDVLGNKIDGATVTLYKSQADWVNKTNPVISGLTNSSGTVRFDSLPSLQYYWSANRYCENNVNGSATTTTPIAAHMTTSITTVLAGTGTIIYVNNSADPYTVSRRQTKNNQCVAPGSLTQPKC